MLVLFQTSTGYAIFKLLDDKKLSCTATELLQDFKNPESARKVVELKHFHKFLDTTEALEATTATIEGKVSKSLENALEENFSKDDKKLLVACIKLGSAIEKKLGIECLVSPKVDVIMRCIRSQADSLIEGLPEQEMALTLGLATCLYRQKLNLLALKENSFINPV